MPENKLISESRIRQIVGLIDLTNLNDDCDSRAIEALCRQARTPVGYVAAICIWPEFISEAKKILGQSAPVKVATVVNFPAGDEPLDKTRQAIDKALDDGGDEIDYVLPYADLIKGETSQVGDALQKVRTYIPNNKIWKVILETGTLGSDELIRTAANLAIEHGADFIKTSTGKVPVNATPESAIVMLDAIAASQRDVGFKAAGGIRTIDDANVYLELSEKRLGKHWIDSAHFRFGASGLLQDALRNLDIEQTPTNSIGGNY